MTVERATGPGIVALAETREQVIALHGKFHAATVVAVTPGAEYALRDGLRRSDPSIEDLCNERSLDQSGTETIDLIESLADRVDSIVSTVLGDLDPHGDLSLRGYFHYLKANFDGIAIRIEQIRQALRELRPSEVVAFRMATPWRMSGLTSFDKPCLSLTSHLTPAVATAMGLPVTWLDAPSGLVMNEPPADNWRAQAEPQQESDRGVRWPHLLWQRIADFRQRRSRRPLLVHSLFDDLGQTIVANWRTAGGEAMSLAEFIRESGGNAAVSSIGLQCTRLYQQVCSDAQVAAFLRRDGVSLLPFMAELLERIIVGRFPRLAIERIQLEHAINRRRDVVILSGGMVDSHYVAGRVAGRAGVPFVSHHYGGFLGYSLLPIHERYDLAECDYFACGGIEARRTFLAPSSLSRWRAGTKRARPVSTGLPWIEELIRRYRTASGPPHPVRRVMIVLNALVGDCRYLGYVFPPEIEYWRFTQRVVERLARSRLEVIVKPPLSGRYPQQVSPLEEWLEGKRMPNVRMLREVPLRDCMDEADAFLIEGPSTPLLHVVATAKPLLLYANSEVYRMVPAARAMLRRRAAAFGETEEEFMRSLESYMEEFEAGRAVVGPTPDDEFLKLFCQSPGEHGAAERLGEFLWYARRGHPLDEQALAAFSRGAVAANDGSVYAQR